MQFLRWIWGNKGEALVRLAIVVLSGKVGGAYAGLVFHSLPWGGAIMNELNEMGKASYTCPPCVPSPLPPLKITNYAMQASPG